MRKVMLMLGADDFSKQIQRFANEAPRNEKVLIAVSGEVSLHARQQLAALNHNLGDHLASGPIR